MNFSFLSAQRVIAAWFLYAEGCVFVWVLNHFLVFSISSSVVYFIILQIVFVWYCISAIEIVDAYESRDKMKNNTFYGQEMIGGVSLILMGVFGIMTCVLAAPAIIILINSNCKTS